MSFVRYFHKLSTSNNCSSCGFAEFGRVQEAAELLLSQLLSFLRGAVFFYFFENSLLHSKNTTYNMSVSVNKSKSKILSPELAAIVADVRGFFYYKFT